MPLDKSMNPPEWEDQLFFNRAIWYLKFAWLPQRCVKTGKLLWLTRAYKGTVMWTGPGDPVYEHKWMSRSEFLFNRLRGTI